MSLRNTLLIITLLISPITHADIFPDNTNYQVCFTPGGNCEQLIIDTIASAKQSIYVQAYTFDAHNIENALATAKKSGVDVNIILDKSQAKKNSKESISTASFFQDSLIPTWIDYIPTIAHNKVMIIDGKTVITGSFNFTNAAQNHHAENVIIITDAALAKKYFDNWMSRKQVSIPAQDYHPQ